jgi:hypothetical protein
MCARNYAFFSAVNHRSTASNILPETDFVSARATLPFLKH